MTGSAICSMLSLSLCMLQLITTSVPLRPLPPPPYYGHGKVALHNCVVVEEEVAAVPGSIAINLCEILLPQLITADRQ